MTINLKKGHLILVLVSAAIGFGGYYLLWPKESKQHPPVKTFGAYWLTPNKDTQSILFRLDYDTVTPFKKWYPRYYYPVWRYDSIHKAASIATAKDSVSRSLRFIFLDTSNLIRDDHKNYRLDL